MFGVGVGVWESRERRARREKLLSCKESDGR